MKTYFKGIAVLMALLSLASGCSEKGSAAKKESASGKFALAEQFGKALADQDYERAYSFASNRLKNVMGHDAFIEDCRAAQLKYEKVLKVEVHENDLEAEDIRDEEIVPPDIPKDSVRAWMIIELALELDAAGETERCYDYWLILVEEEDKLKIGDMYHDWCD